MDLRCAFFRDSHDRWPHHVTTTWHNLCARLSRHDTGPKDGPALTCASFAPGAPRASANVATRVLVALDIELHKATGEIPAAPQSVAAMLTAARQAAMVWTTHGHTPALPRYRVLLPLSRPVPHDAAIDPHISAAAACELGLQAVCDESKFGAASLFFLPRHPEGAEYFTAAVHGEPIAVGYLLTSARTAAEGIAERESIIAARRAARALPADAQAAIARYNAAHPLARQFMRYGYRRDGGRWKSRFQHAASQGATAIVNGGATWVTFSESDAAAGVGTRPHRASSQCAAWGDAFSLFVFYEHGGAFGAALESVRENASCQFRA